MYDLSERIHAVRSLAFAWASLLFTVASFVLVSRRWLLKGRSQRWQDLVEGEDGAAYSISYVFVMPIYLLLVCLMTETALVLFVKMGTEYAAYAAARSAVVWLPAQPPIVEQKIRLAAVNAMTPFASSSSLHGQGMGSGGRGAGTFVEAYQRFARGAASSSYITAKYRYAEGATKVHWSPAHPRLNESVKVTLTYEMPLNTPGAGRILGHKSSSGQFYSLPITSTVALPDEGPVGAESQPSGNPIGIEYYSN
jgi:TadE-like protein